VAYESATARGRNTGTREAGFEAVGEPMGGTREAPRKSNVREFLNEDMLTAYDELEREMNKLKNNIGRRINPNDHEAMRAWRERIRSTKERTLEDLEERASQLAESVQRIRNRTYAGARVIEIAPIAKINANNYDAQLKGLETHTQIVSTGKKTNAETSHAEPVN